MVIQYYMREFIYPNPIKRQARQKVHVFAARAQGHFPIDNREEWVNHISANAAVIIEIGKRDTAIAVHIQIAECPLGSSSRFQTSCDFWKILRPLQNQVK